MADDSGYSGSDEAVSGFGGSPIDKIKKFIPIIIVLVVLVAGVFVFLSLPKPATLTVCVEGMDEDKALEAATVTISGDSQSWVVDLTEKCGDVEGTLPAGVDLSVSVDASSKYSSNPEPSSIRLEAGANRVNFEIPFDYKFTPAPTSISFDVTAGCTKVLPITIKNDGKSVAELKVLPDDALKQFVSVPAAKNIGAGASEKLSLNFSAPAGPAKKISGSLRLAHTLKSIPFSATVGEGAKLGITPNAVQVKNNDKVLITIKNSGKTDITALTVETCYREDKISLGYDAQSIPKELAAGSQTTFPVDITSPEPGKFFAKLCISDGGCQPVEVPITMEKSAPK